MKCFTGLDLCPVHGISNERERERERRRERERATLQCLCSRKLHLQQIFFSFPFFFLLGECFFSPCEIMSALSHLQSPFVSPDLLRILIVQEHLLSKAGK